MIRMVDKEVEIFFLAEERWFKYNLSNWSLCWEISATGELSKNILKIQCAVNIQNAQMVAILVNSKFFTQTIYVTL